MDRKRATSYDDVCEQLDNIEIQLLEQLAVALRGASSKDNELGSYLSLIKSKLLCFAPPESSLVKNKTSKIVNDVQCKVKNVETILNKSEKSGQLVILQKLNSLLAIFNVERCIYVSGCLSKQSQHAKAFHNKQLADIFHCEDILKIKKYFCHNGLEENLKSVTTDNAQDDNQLAVKAFQVCLRKTDSCNGTTQNSANKYRKMNCIGIMTSNKFLPKIPGTKDENLLLCLMAPVDTDANIAPVMFDIPVTTATKAPPNQTVNTRVDIPQPETFSTRQDLSGKITAIDMRHPPLPTSIQNASEHAEMTDLIKRCLTTLQEQRKNGSSLFQMHHKQVLQQGQATSITYKFRLLDGSTVTARTKSKLMGLGQQGEPPFILSVHSIFRDGNLQGLDVQGISPAIRSILSGPIVSDPTSTSIATSGIFSFISSAPSSSMTSTSSMTSSDLVSDIPGLNNWCTSVSGYVRPRNSVEVARELLASTGAQGNGEEIVNEILSPPPHLDGHLVHTIGSSKSPFSIASVATGSNALSTSNNISNQECRSVTSTPDNLATYPGPPCKDISCLKREDQTLPSSCSAQSPLLFVNGINTMQHEAVVTSMATTFPDIKPLIITNPNVTSPHSDITSSSNLPSRVRSASMNSAPPSVNLPKRSISTPSQEEQLKPTPKSARHKAAATNNKLLAGLLTDGIKVPEPHLLGITSDPLLSSSSISTNVTSSTTESLGTLIEPLSPLQDTKPNPSDFQLTSHTTSTVNSEASFFNSPAFKGFKSTRPSVTTNVSKEELDELCAILTGFSDEAENNVFGATPPALSHPPLPDGDFGQQGNFGILPSTDVNNNEIITSSSVFDSQSKAAQGGFHQDIAITPPFTSKPDFMMSQMDAQPGTMTPMYQGAAMAAVPTGFESCPNRVVGNAGIVSPQIQAPVQSPMGPAPQYPSFNTQESWEGKEPLVDLGSYPLPRGVNPRMAIPVPNNMDTTINRLSNGSLMQRNSQMQNDNMTYQMNTQMTRNVRNNGPAMTDISSQGMPLMNTPGAPGAFPNPRLNNGHMDSGIRSIMNTRTNMQPNTGSTLQTNPSMLRRQLQIRLNQPNVNGGSFDSGDILAGGVKRGPTPQHMYPRPDVTHTGITAQKRNEYLFKANRLQDQKHLAMQRTLASTNGHVGIMRSPSQLNSPRYMPLMNGQQPNLNQQPFPRMSNFTSTQRMSTSPGFSTPGGALPMNGEMYPQSTTMTPLQINQPINGGQHYSLTSTPPIQGFANSPFSQPVRPGLGMTSPDTQQFSGLSPPLTSQSPKAKKPRVRKSRKNSASKTKPDLKRKQSTDDMTWNDIAPSIGGNLLSPQYCTQVATVEAPSPPVESKKAKKKIARRMQMTIGDMHQRLQPTLNDASQDVATSSIMTSCSSLQIMTSRPQTLNLNVLLDQYKMKQDGQTNANNFSNTFIQPTDSQPYAPNHTTLTSPVGNQWSGQMNKVTNNNAFNTNSSIQIDNKPLTNCGDLLLHSTSTNLSESNFFSTTTESNHCDVPMNSNVNNNNTISNCRYTASVASAPILTPPPYAATSSSSSMTSSLTPLKRSVERKPSLLETLLLKKDLD